MMNRRKFSRITLCLTLVLGFCLGFGSCKTENKETVEYPNWQAVNEQAFADTFSVAQRAISSGSQDWKILKNTMIPDQVVSEDMDNVVVRVLNKGTGSGCPLFTDSVKIAYMGKLLPSLSYPTGKIFDKTFEGNTLNPKTAYAAKMQVSSSILGMQTALQHMHIGDVWRLFIPYKLGYKETGTTGIPGYSMLIFDVYLDSYYRTGTQVQAKEDLWIEE